MDVYLAVDKDGSEVIFYERPPVRMKRDWIPIDRNHLYKNLKEGTIEKILSKKIISQMLY